MDAHSLLPESDMNTFRREPTEVEGIRLFVWLDGSTMWYLYFQHHGLIISVLLVKLYIYVVALLMGDS